ncbi:recombinase family protein [Roseateles sp. 22389]|uniref:recombinase family protein n=1 Tax=Roseateles sp. 22389 TaxID=3453916 RepID=UPI003F8659E3
MTTPATARPKAFSYVRFSTPDQQKGDSYRRQVTIARRYADQHGLDLDESLDLHDLGLSAFRGANAESGRLADFLELLRDGHIPKGSYLLVESLDRLSRQTARKALRTLEDIIEAGVNVVTLFDERIYDLKSLEGTDLLIALLFMIRANEESATKARRLRHAWEQKREQASASPGGRLTSLAPAWLRATDNGFVVIEEYAEVVRDIFAMALSGQGRQTIAATLNVRGTAPFAWEQGRRRRAGSSGWHASYVGRILSNSAVIGTMTPHTYQHIAGKSTRVALDAIPGYYPNIVEEEVWAAVQALRSVRKPRGAASKSPVKNPLGGLLRCHCGRSIVRANKGKGADGTVWSYYMCVGSKEKGSLRCGFFKPMRAEQVESAIWDQLPAALRSCPGEGERAKELNWNLGAVMAALGRVEQALSALVTEAESSYLSPTVRSRIDSLEADRARHRAEANSLERELQQIAPGISQRRSLSLADALDAGAASAEETNAICRSIFTEGAYDPLERLIRLTWRHGGSVSIQLPTLSRATRTNVQNRGKAGRFTSNR